MGLGANAVNGGTGSLLAGDQGNQAVEFGVDRVEVVVLEDKEVSWDSWFYLEGKRTLM